MPYRCRGHYILKSLEQLRDIGVDARWNDWLAGFVVKRVGVQGPGLAHCAALWHLAEYPSQAVEREDLDGPPDQSLICGGISS